MTMFAPYCAPNTISRPGGLNTVISRYGAGAGANALRLQSLEHRNADGSVWQAHSYAYDLAGEITTWTQPRRQWALRQKKVARHTFDISSS